MRPVFLALFGVLAMGAMQAPVVVTGVVRDPVTRTPIVGAVVTANGDADSAMTDAAGRYAIRRSSWAQVSLAVKRPGYLTLVVPMIAVGSDTLHFDAELHSDPARLMSRSGIAVPQPLILIRWSPDSLVAAISDSAVFQRGPRPADSLLHTVDVIKRRSAKAVIYGPTGQAGGVIRVVMKKAAAFQFED